MEIDRRALMRGALAAGAGMGATVAAERVARVLGPGREPMGGGYAPAADDLAALRGHSVETVWYADVDGPLVALTFDDGPQPLWTPMVLDRLDEAEAPATFFMIGAHLRVNRGIVAGRLGRHEVGNHTWSHPDLAEMDMRQVHDQLRRAEDEITAATGRRPTIMRPPWGHLAGSTLLAANALGYDVVLWSQQMSPRRFRYDTSAQVADLVRNAKPGGIILAHDVGDPARLPGLRGLTDLVTGLREAGFRLVTVSELLAARRVSPGGQPPYSA